MHIHSLERWRHDHNFNVDTSEGERRTRLVVLLTAVMMVVEIAAGYLFGSMALLADGWHMGTHVAALAISLFAYRYARQNAENPRFSFGTGKVTALGGFASAISLAMVALLMGVESVERLHPRQSASIRRFWWRSWAWRSTCSAPGCCMAGPPRTTIIMMTITMGTLITMTRICVPPTCM